MKDRVIHECHLNFYSNINFTLYRTSTAASSNETKNTFSNDGSFLEQFKKMQQKSETDYNTKSEYGSRKEYGDKSTSKQSNLSLGYTIKTNVDTQKGILSQPPPPPPSLSEIKDTAPQGILS